MPKVGVKFSDSDKLENFLGGTVLEVEAAKERFLKDAANKTKAAVKRYIPRTIGIRRHTERKRMADDIQTELVPDTIYGGKRARIRGGKDTGRLWHVVDRGTWRSQARPFMEKSILDVEGSIDAALDAALNEEFRK